MEIIRKKICFEKSRSRKQGLLPYIPFNVKVDNSNPFYYPTKDDYNGNFGGFVANPIINNKVNNYTDLIIKYNRVMDDLRNSLKLIQVNQKSCKGTTNWVIDTEESTNLLEYDEILPLNLFFKIKDGLYRIDSTKVYRSKKVLAITDYDYIYANFKISKDSLISEVKKFCNSIETLIGEITVPSNIEGDLVPTKICLCDINSELEWLEMNKLSMDCCVQKRWEAKGGQEMIDFLEANKDLYEESLAELAKYVDKEKSIPFIQIPVLLTESYDSLGVMTTYYDESFISSGITSTSSSKCSNLYVESKLQSLRIQRYYYDDDGNLLPGLYYERTENEKESDEIRYYQKVKSGLSGEYEWDSIDDDVIIDNKLPYESYTLLQSAPDPNLTSAPTYIKVRFINTITGDIYAPMSVPFKVNVPLNISTVYTDMYNEEGEQIQETVTYNDITCYVFRGDFVTKITKLDLDEDGEYDDIIIEYVLGGTYYAEFDEEYNKYNFVHYVDGTGIKYRDEYPFKPAEEYVINLDGKSNVTIYCDEIDYDSAKVTVNHQFIDASLDINESEILSYEKDSIWTKSGETLNAPVYKEDYLMGNMLEIGTTVDVEVSRGNAAAFEKHYKLSECNTFEDLENMTNNIFNL